MWKLALGQHEHRIQAEGPPMPRLQMPPASTPAAGFDNPSAWKHPSGAGGSKACCGAVAELCETLLLCAREKGSAWTAGTWLRPVVDVNAQGLSITRSVIVCGTSTFQGLAPKSSGDSYIPNQTPCGARFVPPAGCEHKVRVIKDTSPVVGREGLR